MNTDIFPAVVSLIFGGEKQQSQKHLCLNLQALRVLKAETVLKGRYKVKQNWNSKGRGGGGGGQYGYFLEEHM